MKKIYLSPVTETVNVKLFNSVLGPGDLPIGNSPYAEDPLAKEQGDFFEMEDDTFGDLWSDGGDTGNSYDIWKE